MYNRSASSRASIWSFLFPSRLFFRGSHTTSFVTCGFSRSYNQVAQVPSSKVTCNSPRSPWIKSRMAFALVSITHSIAIFPAAFLTAIEILSLCTSMPIYLMLVIRNTLMTSIKYIGMDVHKESISIAVRNAAGKIAMECVIETKANAILDFIHGLRGELQVTLEEGTWATWLYDLLKPHVTKLVVCDPRKNSRDGNKNDQIDARELADRLYMNKLSSVYHGGAGVRTLKELARSYLTISKDLARVMSRVKAIYRS